MEGETAGNGGHNDRHLTVNTHRRFIALHSPPFVKGLSSGGMTGRRNGRETASQDNGCTKKNRGARDQSKHEASSGLTSPACNRVRGRISVSTLAQQRPRTPALL